MNMIVCDQRCRHQEDGYCTLNRISQLSNNISAKCGYYEAYSDDNDDSDQWALSEDAQRL